MKNKTKLFFLITLALLLFSFVFVSCKSDYKNITFIGTVESVSDTSILVTTSDNVGFGKASVDITKCKPSFVIEVGQKLRITIKPEIRESYPVQVTGVKIEKMGNTNNEAKSESSSDTVQYKKITAEEAIKMMDSDVIILDVRTKQEFDAGHIKDAVLLTDSEIKEKAESVLPDKDQTILVYCRSGRRSAAAARELISLGYTNVYDFGGIETDWKGEVVK